MNFETSCTVCVKISYLLHLMLMSVSRPRSFSAFSNLVISESQITDVLSTSSRTLRNHQMLNESFLVDVSNNDVHPQQSLQSIFSVVDDYQNVLCLSSVTWQVLSSHRLSGLRCANVRLMATELSRVSFYWYHQYQCWYQAGFGILLPNAEDPMGPVHISASLVVLAVRRTSVRYHQSSCSTPIVPSLITSKLTLFFPTGTRLSFVSPVLLPCAAGVHST